jgi:LL-diaminopimelate aminotransferase
MVKRNPHLAKLQSGYIFPEILKRKQSFLEKNPQAHLINLGIGDTTEPLPPFIAQALAQTAQNLALAGGYSGYGPEEGYRDLRQQIAQQLYQDRFDADEIFISDGTNCDIGRLQVLFGSQATMAVQDPTYPVYVDTGVILGQAAHFHMPSRKYQGISYMPCLPSHHFFPLLDQVNPTDLIYFCSPNNPTGAVATHAQLEELVAFARQHHSIIIYDTAYASYIQQSDLPRSIYDIQGARQVAIELGSFSKMAGFTGVRLAWSIVPKELQFEDGHPIHQDWIRVHSTFFNGASNIAQRGGLAVLQPEGQKSIQALIHYYMTNASLLRQALEESIDEVYGGQNAPYLWIRFPHQHSWQAFDLLLEKAHLVCAPGSGFGPAGEGFVRLSAFGKRSQIEEAAHRLKNLLQTL